MGKRIAVTGGRDYANYDKVKEVFDIYQITSDDTIVEGGASGLDRLCAKEAYKRGIPIEEYLPNWNDLGRRAGPMRNKEMMQSGIDYLIAFPGGAGTKNCIREAYRNNVPVYRVRD